MALVNEQGKILERTQVSTVKDPRTLVRSLRESVGKWLSRPLLGTGIGVAGDVDPRKGIVRFSANLGWTNVKLAELFRRAKFPAPVVVDNDATAAAWGASYLELGGRSKNLVVLTLGTGVGGGLSLTVACIGAPRERRGKWGT